MVSDSAMDTMTRSREYRRLLPALRDAARLHGYALAVHGSEVRDFDLIAAPWVVDAAPPAVLAEALREAIDGFILEGTYAGRDFAAPAQRPHGRQAWSIRLSGRGERYIDLSVMPPASMEVPS